MAKQTINLGTMADNKSGDPLRTAFTKINQNFDELYAADGQSTPTLSVSYGEDLFEGVSLLNIVGNVMVGNPDPGVLDVVLPDYATTNDIETAINNIPSQTGEVTFNGVNIVGHSVGQVGTIIGIETDYNGNQPGTNGTGVQVPADILGIDQVTAGWIITLATGHRVPLIASYYWADGNFWVLQWDQNYSSSNPVYPLTVETSDYQVGEPTRLTLTSGTTAPGSAVVLNETSVDINFSMVGNKFKFKPNGDLQINTGTIVDQNGDSLLNQGGAGGITANVATTLGTVVYCPSQSFVYMQGDVASAFPTDQVFYFTGHSDQFTVISAVSEYGMTGVTFSPDLPFWPQSNDTAFSLSQTAVTEIQGGVGIDLSVSGQAVVLGKSTTSADNHILIVNQTNAAWQEGQPDPQVFNIVDYNSPDLFVMSHNGASTNIQVVLPPTPVAGKQHTIKYTGRGENPYTCTVFADDKTIDNAGNSIVIDKDNGFVTLVWDAGWNTWWVVGKDII